MDEQKKAKLTQKFRVLVVEDFLNGYNVGLKEE